MKTRSKVPGILRILPFTSATGVLVLSVVVHPFFHQHGSMLLILYLHCVQVSYLCQLKCQAWNVFSIWNRFVLRGKFCLSFAFRLNSDLTLEKHTQIWALGTKFESHLLKSWLPPQTDCITTNSGEFCAMTPTGHISERQFKPSQSVTMSLW